MKQPKDSTIIVCSILRNAEKGLRRNIPVMKQILSQFNDYRTVIYENDSVDATKQIISGWEAEDKEHIHAIMCNTDPTATTPTKISRVGANRFFCHKRIDHMADLRNKYMEYIDKEGWPADYLMVVDMDVEQIYAKPILDVFKQDKEWDAICTYGFGIRSGFKRCYYDTYALTKWEDRDKVQTEEIIYESNRSLDTVKVSDPWIRVASAFGGMMICRYDAIKGLRYETLDNDDERVEVRCEHFSIYKQMLERGYDKFYVVPSMQLKYQGLTWEVIQRAVRMYWNKYVTKK